MYRLGSVSYLNAKPLIYGLERDPAVKLGLDVPSGLLGGLRREEYDVALLPVIDYQRMPGLRMLTCGGIGSDGPTLTVRIFSHVPFAQIRNMACDTDSHTSVALSRVILAERFGTHPAFVDLKSVPVRRATVMRRSTDTTGETPVLRSWPFPARRPGRWVA